MQNEFQPEENQTPLTAKPAAPLATETEADAQAVADITKRLNEITHRSNRARRRFWIALSVLVAFIMLSPLIVSLLTGSSGALYSRLLLSSMAAGIFAVVANFGFWSRAAPKFDAAELAQIGGVQAIIPLFVSLKNPLSSKQTMAIESALTTLLPQMKAGDAKIITPIARQTIHKWLNSANDRNPTYFYPAPLRLAALKALEQVGDARDIQVVKRLAKMKPRTPEQEELKQAAIECLPMLLANCGEVEAARTLLRASHSEAARPNTLLRPASGAGETAAQELLRPSDEESGP